MASDQAITRCIDVGRSQAQFTFFVDADNDAISRPTRRRTCGREEFHTLIETFPVETRRITRVTASTTQQAWDQVRLRPLILLLQPQAPCVNQGLSRTFQKR